MLNGTCTRAMAHILAAAMLTAPTFTLHAQEAGKHGADYTYAPGSPEYWRNTHSTRPNDFVFTRDTNVWVYTKEVAQRAGMPLEWASDELKGVAAAAFRMEPNSLGPSCGWGRNPNACKVEMRCVLELYFDRQVHPLPWAPNRMVADFYWQDVSSAYHFLPANGFGPAENGDRSRGSEKSKNFPNLAARSPFSDPSTGEELGFEPGTDDPGSTRLGAHKVIAYDREIHSRYAFVRLHKNCSDALSINPKGATLELGSRTKVFHRIFFPSDWTRRLVAVGEAAKQADNDFYKNIWNNLNTQGDKK